MRALYINGRYLTQQATGVQRFAAEIVRAIDIQICSDESRAQVPYYLVVPIGDFTVPHLSSIRVIQSGRLTGHAWEQLELPRIARSGILFNPCGPAPWFHANQITTLHDASVYVAPAGYSWQFRTWHKSLIWRSGKHAKLIFTVSRFSAQQLIEICNIPPQKLRVIYPSGSHILRQQSDTTILRKHALDDKVPYVLCVGSQQANKNFSAVVEASTLLKGYGLRFVVVGSTNSSVFRNSVSNDENITLTGYVTDPELRALYENALCFVFPSLQEGFGIPPLEAMACGCPVIASNASSIPEACGAAPLYFDPLRPDILSSRIMDVLESIDLRRQMRERGLEHAHKFTWELTAKRILEIFEENCGA